MRKREKLKKREKPSERLSIDESKVIKIGILP
jgi:hypothetical protein